MIERYVIKDNLIIDKCDYKNPINLNEACYILNYFNNKINEISEELYCKDRKLEELGIPIECCDKDE